MQCWAWLWFPPEWFLLQSRVFATRKLFALSLPPSAGDSRSQPRASRRGPKRHNLWSGSRRPVGNRGRLARPRSPPSRDCACFPSPLCILSSSTPMNISRLLIHRKKDTLLKHHSSDLHTLIITSLTRLCLLPFFIMNIKVWHFIFSSTACYSNLAIYDHISLIHFPGTMFYFFSPSLSRAKPSWHIPLSPECPKPMHTKWSALLQFQCVKIAVGSGLGLHAEASAWRWCQCQRLGFVPL